MIYCFLGNLPGKYSIISINFHQNPRQFISFKIMASHEILRNNILGAHLLFFTFHFERLSSYFHVL